MKSSEVSSHVQASAGGIRLRLVRGVIAFVRDLLPGAIALLVDFRAACRFERGLERSIRHAQVAVDLPLNDERRARVVGIEHRKTVADRNEAQRRGAFFGEGGKRLATNRLALLRTAEVLGT